MRKRFFLIVVGLTGPLAATAGGTLGGCSNVIEVVPPSSGSGGHAGHHPADGGTGGFGGGPIDAQPDYTDPGCPDAGAPMTMFMCDPYNQNNGDCPPAEGCYIFTDPPETPCAQEVYGASCEHQGSGQQGTPCGGSEGCAAGFTCVVSGSGNQCVQLCELQGDTGCPNGLVCNPIDVQGFGGCL
jgi:hypothetical protein